MVGRESHVGFTTNPHALSESIVRLARQQTATTRTEIAEATAAGKSIITQRVAELVGAGILIDEGTAASTGGRAPRALRFNRGGALLIGVEINAARIDVVATDFTGTIVLQTSEEHDVRDGPVATLARVIDLIDRVKHALPPGSPPVLGVGVGLPGPVDFTAGSMVSPPSLPAWNAYPFRARLARALGTEVWVDNDVNAMVVGERALDDDRSLQNVIVVNIGLGIGAGLFIDGRLYRGSDGGAGDIGHVAYGDSNVPCFCGKTGCLSTIAGGVALTEMARSHAGGSESAILGEVVRRAGRLTLHEVADAVALGDPFCIGIVAEAGRQIGRVISLMVGVLNPSLVILAGELCVDSDVLLTAVRTSVIAHAPTIASRALEIRNSRLGTWSGAIGAAQMCIDELLTADRIRSWVESGGRAFAEAPAVVAPAVSARPVH
ncbi:ROK family protein [Subtercola sp. YIM 133946]|uniref:ROK family protein n=1 Tax=Subtercola sp. YIM 133946 TaxID=3118909 RepID=UPI002F95594F